MMPINTFLIDRMASLSFDIAVGSNLKISFSSHSALLTASTFADFFSCCIFSGELPMCLFFLGGRRRWGLPGSCWLVREGLLFSFRRWEATSSCLFRYD